MNSGGLTYHVFLDYSCQQFVLSPALTRLFCINHQRPLEEAKMRAIRQGFHVGMSGYDKQVGTKTCSAMGL